MSHLSGTAVNELESHALWCLSIQVNLETVISWGNKILFFLDGNMAPFTNVIGNVFGFSLSERDALLYSANQLQNQSLT